MQIEQVRVNEYPLIVVVLGSLYTSRADSVGSIWFKEKANFKNITYFYFRWRDKLYISVTLKREKFLAIWQERQLNVAQYVRTQKVNGISVLRKTKF